MEYPGKSSQLQAQDKRKKLQETIEPPEVQFTSQKIVECNRKIFRICDTLKALGVRVKPKVNVTSCEEVFGQYKELIGIILYLQEQFDNNRYKNVFSNIFKEIAEDIPTDQLIQQQTDKKYKFQEELQSSDSPKQPQSATLQQQSVDSSHSSSSTYNIESDKQEELKAGSPSYPLIRQQKQRKKNSVRKSVESVKQRTRIVTLDEKYLVPNYFDGYQEEEDFGIDQKSIWDTVHQASQKINNKHSPICIAYEKPENRMDFHQNSDRDSPLTNNPKAFVTFNKKGEKKLEITQQNSHQNVKEDKKNLDYQGEEEKVNKNREKKKNAFTSSLQNQRYNAVSPKHFQEVYVNKNKNQIITNIEQEVEIMKMKSEQQYKYNRSKEYKNIKHSNNDNQSFRKIEQVNYPQDQVSAFNLKEMKPLSGTRTPEQQNVQFQKNRLLNLNENNASAGNLDSKKYPRNLTYETNTKLQNYQLYEKTISIPQLSSSNSEDFQNLTFDKSHSMTPPQKHTCAKHSVPNQIQQSEIVPESEKKQKTKEHHHPNLVIKKKRQPTKVETKDQIQFLQDSLPKLNMKIVSPHRQQRLGQERQQQPGIKTILLSKQLSNESLVPLANRNILEFIKSQFYSPQMAPDTQSVANEMSPKQKPNNTQSMTNVETKCTVIREIKNQEKNKIKLEIGNKCNDEVDVKQIDDDEIVDLKMGNKKTMSLNFKSLVNCTTTIQVGCQKPVVYPISQKKIDE